MPWGQPVGDSLPPAFALEIPYHMPSSSSAVDQLTQNHLLARNAIWNFAGAAVPLAAAILVTPLVVRGLGADRYGVLALVAAAIGYFGLFDLGLGRALAKLVAEQIGRGTEERVPDIVGTALLSMAALGLVGGGLAAAATPSAVSQIIEIPPYLASEVEYSFYVLAAGIPVLTTAVGARAVLEAYQKFVLLNSIRIPLALLFAVAPLLVLAFTNNLLAVVSATLATRVIDWAIHMYLCVAFLRERGGAPAFRKDFLGPLFRFGGWLTVSSTVGPIMVYFDRFLIGALISVEAVTYYSVPHGVLTRLLIVPGALLGVLFPAFSTLLAYDTARATRMMGHGINTVMLSLAPATLFFVPMSEPLLALWIDAEFALHSAVIAQILCVGVLINAVAHIPFAYIQAHGRPDLTAKLHLMELLPYAAILWWLTANFGAVGAAVAWTVRVIIDTILLFMIAGLLSPVARPALHRSLSILTFVAACAGASAFVDDPAIRLAFAIIAPPTTFVWTWFGMFTRDERVAIIHRFRALRAARQRG